MQAGKRQNLESRATKKKPKKWDEGGTYRIALHTAAGAPGGGLSGATGAAASASAANLMNELQGGIQQSLQGSGLSADVAKTIAQTVAGMTAAGLGASVGGSYGAAAGLTVDANNRQLHPIEVKLIKDNARRYAKQVYGTDNPTDEMIEVATARLVNTAQGLLDNNPGVTVPYSKTADYFLQTLKIEYAQQNGSTTLPDTQGQQDVFYATVSQKDMPWINQGLGDSAVTGLIVKTPLAPAYNNPKNDSTRDRMTGLPLDEKGRYTVNVALGDPINGYTNFAPKYLPCASAACIQTGQNLDTSDPATQAYIKALDVQTFKDINTGTTAAILLVPAGVAGGILGTLGVLTSVGAGYAEEKTGSAVAKELLQQAAAQYLSKVYGLGTAAVNRITATVDLAGGWQAFVDRAKGEPSKVQK